MCGAMPSNDERQSDLLDVLPKNIRESFLGAATDPGLYTNFRDMIIAQAAKTLRTTGRAPAHSVHAVEGGEDVPAAALGDGEFEFRPTSSADDPSLPSTVSRNLGEAT